MCVCVYLCNVDRAMYICMHAMQVNASYEMSLQEGLRFERRIFHSMFSLQDQKEGMAAFVEKRAADWQHK